ncbi:hypothetical protein CTA2_11189 [Colletotrichum tanaceti]|nr:hypothetical protein CTA2_11189 [Colletotrichum tanaceti]
MLIFSHGLLQSITLILPSLCLSIYRFSPVLSFHIHDRAVPRQCFPVSPLEIRLTVPADTAHPSRPHTMYNQTFRYQTALFHRRRSLYTPLLADTCHSDTIAKKATASPTNGFRVLHSNADRRFQT